MNAKKLKIDKNLSSKIVTTALMSALLVCGKLALSFVPNVEIVTLLTIVFSYVFGMRAVIATLVFCTLDIFIYPISIDIVIAYYIYWNSLALFVVLVRRRISSVAFYIALAVVATLLFSIITTATYAIFFGVNFFAWYAAGLLFFAIHVASSLVTVAVGFVPLTRVLKKVKDRLEPPNNKEQINQNN